jgi:hypothetical protein
MVGVKVPADQAVRVNADQLRAEAFVGLAGTELLGVAAHLKEAHVLGALPDGVVDHEGHLGVDRDVAVLCRSLQVEPCDLDGAEFGVVSVANWLVLRAPIGCDRRQATTILLVQVADIHFVKHFHTSQSRLTHVRYPRGRVDPAGGATGGRSIPRDVSG